MTVTSIFERGDRQRRAHLAWLRPGSDPRDQHLRGLGLAGSRAVDTAVGSACVKVCATSPAVSSTNSHSTRRSIETVDGAASGMVAAVRGAHRRSHTQTVHGGLAGNLMTTQT